MQSKLIVICGPTGTGKSELALRCAERLNSPILSADSRQVYQEFDIGTAKPSLSDQARVPHELIDICVPTETLTVAQYQQMAQDLIARYHGYGVIPILVGGTGLYIQSVVQGLKIPRVPPQEALRSQLGTIAQLERHQWLAQVDAASAAKIHLNDEIRTLRALEVYYTTGIPLSAQQGTNPPGYAILQVGLDMHDPDLYRRRILSRTQRMVQQGWLDEVNELTYKYGKELPLLRTLGYAEMQQHYRGEISLDDAIAQTVLRTRQFAKRQRTWFRAESNLHWFDAADDDLEQIVWRQIEDWLV
jgi:tRNA dimethylallyltransferase